MTLQRPSQDRQSRQSARVSRNGLVSLGQPHFWLLSGILAGMLALVAIVFLAHVSTR